MLHSVLCRVRLLLPTRSYDAVLDLGSKNMFTLIKNIIRTCVLSIVIGITKDAKMGLLLLI